MAGVKGKSGRKSRYSEIRVAELTNLSVNWAIDNWATMPRDDRMKILVALAPKAIPMSMEHTVDEPLQKIIFERVSRATEQA
jgi:hypothetical protein